VVGSWDGRWLVVVGLVIVMDLYVVVQQGLRLVRCVGEEWNRE
jgi:hypothetical protein